MYLALAVTSSACWVLRPLFLETKVFKKHVTASHRPAWLTVHGIILKKHKNGSFFLGEHRAGEQLQERGVRNAWISGPNDCPHFLLGRLLWTNADETSPASNFPSLQWCWTLSTRTGACCCVISKISSPSHTFTLTLCIWYEPNSTG